MNNFQYLRTVALNSGKVDGTTLYLASDEFRDQVQFEGRQGLVDMVQIQLYMLERVALDPDHSKEMLANLAKGLVALRFFGVSNPLPCFNVKPGGNAATKLQRAIEVNQASRMSAAAIALRKQHTPQRTHKYLRYKERKITQLRNSLGMPSRLDFQTNPNKAQAVMAGIVARIAQKEGELQSRRHARLDVMVRLAQPGIRGWMELLEDIALKVLAPKVPITA